MAQKKQQEPLVFKVGRYTVIDYTVQGHTDPEWGPVYTQIELLGAERRAAYKVFTEANLLGGEELKYARKALGFTRAELAKLLDTQEPVIEYLEGECANIRIITRLAITGLLAQAMQGAKWPPRAWQNKSKKKPQKIFSIKG